MKYRFDSRDISLCLSEQGRITSIRVLETEILKQACPLLRLCEGGRVCLPVSMTRSSDTVFTVTAENGKTLTIEIVPGAAAIRIGLLEVSGETDAVEFGPVPVTPDESIGEVLGITRGNGVAFGLMALNIKTVEGFPDAYADRAAAEIAFDEGDMSTSTGNFPITQRAAARLEGGGCGLMFYAMDRTRGAFGKVVGAEHAIIKPLDASDPDAHIGGAALVFYGCAAENALSRIGEIELEYALPHPTLGGEWQKTAREAMKSYLISDFSAEDIDFVLDKAELAGMDTVYQSYPYRSWGHFDWLDGLAASDADFLEKITRKAKARGMHVGIHTLTNFITTNDPYISPIPDGALLKLATVRSETAVSAEDTRITVRYDPAFETALTLNGLQIGSEIAVFGSLSRQGNLLTLSSLTRGAFGTRACAHPAGENVHLLRDYSYKTFFPEIPLQDKMADRLVEQFNKAEIDQVSFDGLEGCEYTGHGIYATARFLMRCADGWDHFVLNDASNLHHFGWHYHTRMNWGEPWGQTMRAGQVEHRLSNQAFFARNLFPRMLGWFLLRTAERKFEATSREDIEWALSEAAGFDAGYSMTVMPNVLKKHGRIDELLSLMRDWDRLRLAGAFTEEQRLQLRDPQNEFRLEKLSENRFQLYPISISPVYTCALGEMQPGQPGGADWTVTNRREASFAFRLRVDGEGEIRDPMFRNAGGAVKFPCTVEDGQYLLFDLDGRCEVTDKNYRTLCRVDPVGTLALPCGTSALSFSCSHDRGDTPDVLVTFLTRGEGTQIEV